MTVLNAFFFNCNSVVALIPPPPQKKGFCVTKDVYIHKMLSIYTKNCKMRRQKSEMRGIKLLHNNATLKVPTMS